MNNDKDLKMKALLNLVLIKDKQIQDFKKKFKIACSSIYFHFFLSLVPDLDKSFNLIQCLELRNRNRIQKQKEVLKCFKVNAELDQFKKLLRISAVTMMHSNLRKIYYQNIINAISNLKNKAQIHKQNNYQRLINAIVNVTKKHKIQAMKVLQNNKDDFRLKINNLVKIVVKQFKKTFFKKIKDDRLRYQRAHKLQKILQKWSKNQIKRSFFEYKLKSFQVDSQNKVALLKLNSLLRMKYMQTIQQTLSSMKESQKGQNRMKLLRMIKIFDAYNRQTQKQVVCKWMHYKDVGKSLRIIFLLLKLKLSCHFKALASYERCIDPFEQIKQFIKKGEKTKTILGQEDAKGKGRGLKKWKRQEGKQERKLILRRQIERLRSEKEEQEVRYGSSLQSAERKFASCKKDLEESSKVLLRTEKRLKEVEMEWSKAEQQNEQSRSELREQIESYEVRCRQLEELNEKQAEQLRKEKAKWKEVSRQLEESIGEVQCQERRREEREGEVEQLKEELGQRREQVATLEDELHQLTCTNKQLVAESKAGEAKARLERLKEEVAALRREKEEGRRKHEGLEKYNAVLYSEVEEKGREVRSLQDQLESLVAQSQVQEVRIGSLQKSQCCLDSRRQSTIEATKEAIRLNEDLLGYKNTIWEQDQEIEKLRRQKDALEDRVQTMLGLLERLQESHEKRLREKDKSEDAQRMRDYIDRRTRQP